MHRMLGIIRGYANLLIYLKYHGCDETAMHHIDLAKDDPKTQALMRNVKAAEDALAAHIAVLDEQARVARETIEAVELGG